LHALAPNILEEGLLFLPIDVPEAEIVFIDGGHFEHVPSVAGENPPRLDQREVPDDRATVIQFLGTAQMTARAKILFFRANLRCWRHAIWPMQRTTRALEAVSRRAPPRVERLSTA
jgi:hypothetical protein